MKHLLERLVVKDMILRNRIVMPPMVTNLASINGEVTERAKTYYSERARGGAALIIIEMSYPHPTGKGFPCMLGVYSDALIPGLNELAEAIKSHGACAALQIGHAGRQTSSDISGHEIVAPSAIPPRGSEEIPKELSIEDIHEIARAFGRAASRAKRAGFDAVEIHGSHGYLLNQFLSPYTNKRTDAYGGNLENRLRFPLEVIKEVKLEVGETYPLIFRLCANEYIEDDKGLTLAIAKEAAPRLVEAGIDVLHITGGISETRDHIVQPSYYNQGHNVYLAEGVKKVVGDTPVITAGSITDPNMADLILEEGKADLIAVGRGHIADPMFLKKIKADKVNEIRRCIRCNECVGRIRSGLRVSCTANPVVGKEAYGQLKPAEKPKKVLVVGAGPAGMEASRILSLRGHNVTLCDKSHELGGLLRIASIPPGKKDLLALVDWLKAELQKCMVDVNLNTEVNPDYIARFNPDALILSTGSNPFIPDIPEIESAVTAVDALKDVSLGDRVIICGGGLVGCEVAWYLAEQNKEIIIVEKLDQIGMDMESGTRMVIMKKLLELGVDIVCNLKVEKIIPGQGIDGIGKSETRRQIRGDSVVLAMGFEPNRTLYDIENKPYEVYLIGDAKKPRRIFDAMREANYTARFEV